MENSIKTIIIRIFYTLLFGGFEIFLIGILIFLASFAVDSISDSTILKGQLPKDLIILIILAPFGFFIIRSLRNLYYIFKNLKPAEVKIKIAGESRRREKTRILILLIFSGTLLTIGILSAIEGIRSITIEWVDVPAKVEESKIDKDFSGGGLTATLKYSYIFNSKKYFGFYRVSSATEEFTQRLVESYPVGSTIVIKVNPENPSETTADFAFIEQRIKQR